jgi:hypothetical protein
MPTPPQQIPNVLARLRDELLNRRKNLPTWPHSTYDVAYAEGLCDGLDIALDGVEIAMATYAEEHEHE